MTGASRMSQRPAGCASSHPLDGKTLGMLERRRWNASRLRCLAVRARRRRGAEPLPQTCAPTPPRPGLAPLTQACCNTQRCEPTPGRRSGLGRPQATASNNVIPARRARKDTQPRETEGQGVQAQARAQRSCSPGGLVSRSCGSDPQRCTPGPARRRAASAARAERATPLRVRAPKRRLPRAAQLRAPKARWSRRGTATADPSAAPTRSSAPAPRVAARRRLGLLRRHRPTRFTTRAAGPSPHG